MVRLTSDVSVISEWNEEREAQGLKNALISKTQSTKRFLSLIILK